MNPENCRHYPFCSAPLCPLDLGLQNAIFFPDEPICHRRLGLDWLKIQRRIARKAKDRTRYFTYKDFMIKRVQSPRGHNADAVLR